MISPHKIPVDYDLNLGLPPEYVSCTYPAQEASSNEIQQLKKNNTQVSLKVEDLGRRTVVKVEAAKWRNLSEDDKKLVLNNVHTAGLGDEKTGDTLFYSCNSEEEIYLAYKLSKNGEIIEVMEWILLGVPVKRLSF
jgi:hypothetical protein